MLIHEYIPGEILYGWLDIIVHEHPCGGHRGEGKGTCSTMEVKSQKQKYEWKFV